MIKWRRPEECPPDNAIVACIEKHSKRDTHMNCEIMFGEVNISNDGKSWMVCTNDETGKGLWGLYYPENRYSGTVFAWCFADEINLPKWIKE